MKQKKINLGAKLSYLCISGLEFGKTIVIFEISTVEFIKCKVSCDKKNLGQKLSYLGIFGLKLGKNYCHI